MEHGTRYMYVAGKCRCAECTRANADYSSLWASRNPEKKNRQQRERYVRRRKIVDEIKLSSGCCVCGYNFHPAALDFHHGGDDKEFGIGAHSNAGWNRVLSEISKCVVMCANCHRELHATIDLGEEKDTLNWHSSQIAMQNYLEEEE